MKFGIVVFPGSNCDNDLKWALEQFPGAEVSFLWHKDTDLKNSDMIFIPGGFSYGDYLRSGAIAKLSPIMQSVTRFANDGGLVMGICNGFQILCESGLLPGALLRNSNRKFICSNVFITPANKSLITSNIGDKKALKIPIAHGEGRYYADEHTLQFIEMNGQVIFRYCDEHGNINDASNPNGSLNNIAGICNEHRNVFGTMPHPERAAFKELFNDDGQLILSAFTKSQAVTA